MRVDWLVSSPRCLTPSLRCVLSTVLKLYKDPVPNSASTTDVNWQWILQGWLIVGFYIDITTSVCRFITDLFQLSRHLSTNCYGLFIKIVSALSASDINNCFIVCIGLLTNVVAAMLLRRKIHRTELVTNKACLLGRGKMSRESFLVMPEVFFYGLYIY